MSTSGRARGERSSVTQVTAAGAGTEKRQGCADVTRVKAGGVASGATHRAPGR
jgi:hypothetical protein